MHTDPGTSFYLKVAEVKMLNDFAPATGTVRVQVGEPVLDLKAGDYIRVYCWLDRFKPPTNPGQFNTAKYMARKAVFIAASVKSRDGIELLKNPRRGIFTRAKRKIRQTATVALLGAPVPENQSQGLLQALLLGYRRDIDSSTYLAFRKTGLLHFISLSGMHLGILVGIIWWACKTAGLMKRMRAIICIIAVAVFLLIVPPRGPTLRAAIIACVFCASFFFRRRPNSVNTLSLAAIVLLLIRPTQLFEAGWQLSFASVLALVLFSHRIHLFLYEKITAIPWPKKAPKERPLLRIASRPGPYLLRLFSTGITAWMGGAGILLYHFQTITPLTPLWTLAVFPFVAIILTVGYLKIILTFLLPTLALLLGIIATGLADLLILIVRLIADSGTSQILIGHVSPIPVILYYCLVLLLAFAYFRRPLVKKIICIATSLTIILYLGAAKWQRTYPEDLTLTCLDVSHGQAILARLPGKANVLFDAGSLHKSDVGARIVAPFLDYAGISRINTIIVTHDDIDHINGIPEITAHCEVGKVYANDAFFTKTGKWGTAKYLSDCLKESGLQMQRLTNELNVDNKAKMKTLWPTKQVCMDPNLSDNDKSVVSMIEFAGKKILICSDIEKFSQDRLLRLFPDLKADIVIVPHHGSTRTAHPDFLPSLDADILVCSCGRREYERLALVSTHTSNVKTFYTARDGAITIRIKEDGTVTTHAHACGDKITPPVKPDSHGARDTSHVLRI
jgi:competence protein ComEC